MTVSARIPAPVHGMEQEHTGPASPINTPPRSGWIKGIVQRFWYQLGTIPGNNTADVGCGLVAIPAITAGTPVDVTVNDASITTNSRIVLQLMNGTTTPGATALVNLTIKSITAGSFVVTCRCNSTSTLSTDFWFYYEARQMGTG